MRRAFTLIELLVVISIIALLIAILLPVLGAARTQAQILQNTTQMRGIHQAFVMYGQDNDEVFPGLVKAGAEANLLPATIGGQATSASAQNGSWPSTRFALIIQNDYISPDYAINPADPFPREAWTFGPTGTDSAGSRFDWRNFSYAVEEFGESSFSGTNAYKRKQYSINNLDAQTPVVSDRIIRVIGNEFSNPDAYIGVYSPAPGQFRMGLAWNDGHTTIESTAEQDTKFGIYRNTRDNIFIRQGVEIDVITTPTPPDRVQVQSKFCYLDPQSHRGPASEQ